MVAVRRQIPIYNINNVHLMHTFAWNISTRQSLVLLIPRRCDCYPIDSLGFDDIDAASRCHLMLNTLFILASLFLPFCSRRRAALNLLLIFYSYMHNDLLTHEKVFYFCHCA